MPPACVVKTPMTDEKRLQLIGKFDASPYSRSLGIKIVELSDGYVKLTMTVQESHMNFVGLLHGGVSMSLADQAFACATNTLDGNYVAIQFSFNLFGTAKPGDELIAEGRLVHGGRSIGVCEMTVTNSSGKVIARATGTSANIG